MANITKYRGDAYTFDEGIEVVKMVYDFSTDGGAVASLGMMKAKQAMVVHKAIMKVQTACTSGGSATVSLGKTGSVAAFVAATAVASLTANAIIAGVPSAGGVLLAADDVVLLDIAVAALTAGKIEVELFISKF